MCVVTDLAARRNSADGRTSDGNDRADEGICFVPALPMRVRVKYSINDTAYEGEDRALASSSK